MKETFTFQIFPETEYKISKYLVKNGLQVKQNWEGNGEILVNSFEHFLALNGVDKDYLGVKIIHKSYFGWVSYIDNGVKERNFYIPVDYYELLERLYGRKMIVNLMLKSYLDIHVGSVEELVRRREFLMEEIRLIDKRLEELKKLAEEAEK